MDISFFQSISRATAILLTSVFIVFHPLVLGADAQQNSIVIGLLPEMNVFKQKNRFEPLAS